MARALCDLSPRQQCAWLCDTIGSALEQQSDWIELSSGRLVLDLRYRAHVWALLQHTELPHALGPNHRVHINAADYVMYRAQLGPASPSPTAAPLRSSPALPAPPASPASPASPSTSEPVRGRVSFGSLCHTAPDEEATPLAESTTSSAEPAAERRDASPVRPRAEAERGAPRAAKTLKQLQREGYAYLQGQYYAAIELSAEQRRDLYSRAWIKFYAKPPRDSIYTEAYWWISGQQGCRSAATWSWRWAARISLEEPRLEAKYYRVAPTTLTEAGQLLPMDGLFVRQPIRAHVYVGFYTGRYLAPAAEVARPDYVMTVPKRFALSPKDVMFCIDADAEGSLLRYANMCLPHNGLASAQRPRNNLVQKPVGDAVALWTTCAVAADEELLLDYNSKFNGESDASAESDESDASDESSSSYSKSA